MPEAVKERSIFATPAMSVEASPELEIKSTPVRISGFVALFFGLGSFVAVLGEPLIIIPVIAVAFALMAIRPYKLERPVGLIAGYIGLFCAVLFGCWSVSERHFKYELMSKQATGFAKDWLDLVGQGDLELAIELQVHPSRRQPESMPLADYYQRGETGIGMMKHFKEQDIMPRLIDLGMKPKWTLAQPPKVYTQFGRELTQTVWKDTTGSYSQPLKIVMEYIQGDSSDKAQWKIELVSDFVEDSDRV
jgi:hypothetical protein